MIAKQLILLVQVVNTLYFSIIDTFLIYGASYCPTDLLLLYDTPYRYTNL